MVHLEGEGAQACVVVRLQRLLPSALSPCLALISPHFRSSLAQTPEEQFAHEIADFVAKREDNLAQEERWRNKFMRRIGDKFEHIDARLDHMNERFEQLARACSDIKESLSSLRSAQSP